MSQHDLDIANQGFPATRADLNLALKALGSSNSGATAPSTTYANQLWYDTANNILKIRNEDNDAFISLFTLDQSADNIEALTVNGTLTADTVAINGAFTATDGCTITTADNTSQLILKSTDADASAGPRLDLKRDSGSPADNDTVGRFRFLFDNDAAEETEAVRIDAFIPDVSDGTEDATFQTLTMVGGTMRSRVEHSSTETVFNQDSQDIDFRVESDNDANAFFVQGSSGNVGIGSSSPTKPLTVVGSDFSTVLLDTANASHGTQILFQANGAANSGADIQMSDAGGLKIRTLAVEPLSFHTAASAGTSTERMRIDSSGNVGIGCTNGDITSDGNASRKYVTIQGTGNRGRLNLGSTATSGADVGTLGFTNGTNTVAAISVDSDAGSQTNGLMAFATSGSTRMTIDSGGNVLATSGTIGGLGSYNNTTGSAANVHILSSGVLVRSTSSSRYKNTINDATHGLTELLTLRPVTYKGNSDGDTVFGGLIAEEVHDAGLTEFVQYNDDNEPDSLAYANMVSLCIKAIQEQQATITALEARIAALEGA